MQQAAALREEVHTGMSRAVLGRTSSFSLRPSLTSGMPDRKTFMMILPLTSQRSTVPLLDISTLTCSTMSRNTSFFLYFILSVRHPTAPVTCAHHMNLL